MDNEDVTNGDDVTIYLVKKSVTEEANRKKPKGKKRKKQECREDAGTSLGEIHANSRKLRRCSKYFETCMSERWTSDAGTESFEFYLEVETELSYYRDCFSRMNFLFPKQIPSVTHCIELLKVATQIQYQDLVDASMQYLAAVPWTAGEEKDIRDFCNSGHFVVTSASDLSARLELSLTKEERQKQYLDLTRTTLNWHFRFASDPQRWTFDEEAVEEALDHSGLFENAFCSIMSDSESGMCQSLQEYVMKLVKDEAEAILVSIKSFPGPLRVGEKAFRFAWLHEISSRANASQAIVELLLKIEKVNTILMNAAGTVKCIWALTMYDIFEDLSAGHLFLSTSERFILVSDWIWMFKKKYLEDVVAYLSPLLTNIILTFPLLEQQKIYNTWAVSCKQNDPVLADSYSMWLTHLTREASKCEPNLEDVGGVAPSMTDTAFESK